MFELLNNIENFTISSVELVKKLREAGIADKQHSHVLRDIDRMMDEKRLLIEQYGRVCYDGSFVGGEKMHQKDASNFGCIFLVHPILDASLISQPT